MRAILALFILSSCSLLNDSEQSPEPLLLTTDQEVYIAERIVDGPRSIYSFEVTIQVENNSRATIYLARCYPDSPHPIYGFSLVNQEDEWGAAYSAVWACVGHENPIALAPGAKRSDTLVIRGPNAWPNGSTEHFGVLEGTFQIHYQAQSCAKEVGCDLPLSMASTNHFSVELGS